eukprot:757282-Hanusia_phi.AAC.3
MRRARWTAPRRPCHYLPGQRRGPRLPSGGARLYYQIKGPGPIVSELVLRATSRAGHFRDSVSVGPGLMPGFSPVISIIKSGA